MAPKAAGAALDAAWPPEIPGYLREIYWWAYVHPNAVRLFERQWLVNLILFGNFTLLRDTALGALGERLPGKTLQIACVYGDFSARLAQRVEAGGTLDIVDVLPIQLRNLRRKLPRSAPVRTFRCDSAALQLDSASYDQAVLFFLLHEQPEDVRRSTLREAIRVLKPGAKLVIVDYHLPRPLHPLRYLFPPVLRLLEPFALDLWRQPIDAWLPQGFRPASMTHATFFGGLYQKIVITL